VRRLTDPGGVFVRGGWTLTPTETVTMSLGTTPCKVTPVILHGVVSPDCIPRMSHHGSPLDPSQFDPGAPIWGGRVVLSSKVDGCVPQTQDVNLRIVGQRNWGRARACLMLTRGQEGWRF